MNTSDNLMSHKPTYPRDTTEEEKGSWIWEGKKEKENCEKPLGEAKVFESWGLCVKKKKIRNSKWKQKFV